MTQRNLKKTDPGCHGNEIWEKMGHNLTCTWNITEMFAPIRGFGGWTIEGHQTNSTTALATLTFTSVCRTSLKLK